MRIRGERRRINGWRGIYGSRNRRTGGKIWRISCLCPSCWRKRKTNGRTKVLPSYWRSRKISFLFPSFLFTWLPYQDTTTLHSYHDTSYLIPLIIPWYGKREGERLYYRCSWVCGVAMWKLPHSILIQLCKISNSREFLSCHKA